MNFLLSVVLCSEPNCNTKFRCQMPIEVGLDIKNASKMCHLGNDLLKIKNASVQIVTRPQNEVDDVKSRLGERGSENETCPFLSYHDLCVKLKLYAKTPIANVLRLKNVRFNIELASKSHGHRIKYNGYTEDSGYKLEDFGLQWISPLKAPAPCLSSIFDASHEKWMKIHDRQLNVTNVAEIKHFHWDIYFSRSLSRPDLKGPWEIRITFFELTSAIDEDILNILEIEADNQKLLTKKTTLGRVVIPFSVE